MSAEPRWHPGWNEEASKVAPYKGRNQVRKLLRPFVDQAVAAGQGFEDKVFRRRKGGPFARRDQAVPLSHNCHYREGEPPQHIRKGRQVFEDGLLPPDRLFVFTKEI